MSIETQVEPVGGEHGSVGIAHAVLLHGRTVAHTYSLAFVALDLSGRGPASRVCGSGTLVDFLGIRGVVTAAHVAVALAGIEEVGLNTFKPSKTLEAIAFRGSELETTKIGDAPFSVGGPDLAFIRLPLGWLVGV